jgi:large subunit ribosomal protein L35
MAYKFKPNKSVAKRLRLTKTGKLKRNHSLTSHLRSGRSPALERRLRRPAILVESHARNMRKLMGVSGRHPGKVKHQRDLAAAAAAKAQAAQTPAATPADAPAGTP